MHFSHCIGAMPEFNQSLLDFFNLFDSRLILILLYDFLNLVMQCIQLGAFVGHCSGERKSRVPQQLDCVARTKHQYSKSKVGHF